MANPFYSDPEEMLSKIEDYFDNCPDVKKMMVCGNVDYVAVPTMTGLALYLGFCSRQSIYDYEEREGFSYTIKKAKSLAERHYEMCAQAGLIDKTFAIFALKQFGWTDRVEQKIEHTGEVTGFTISAPNEC